LLDVDELDGIAEDVGIRTEKDSVIYVLTGRRWKHTPVFCVMPRMTYLVAVNVKSNSVADMTMLSATVPRGEGWRIVSTLLSTHGGCMQQTT
jgi:hypothetical protein